MHANKILNGMHAVRYATATFLGIIGVGGVVVGGFVLQAGIYAATHNTDAVTFRDNDVIAVALHDFMSIPGIAMLIVACLSLLGTYLLLTARYRWRLARPLVSCIVGSVVALDVALLGSSGTLLWPGPLTPMLTTPAPPLVASHYARYGTIGSPAPGTLTQPARVYRLFADGAATYLQYDIGDVAHDGQPTPVLIDDRGTVYTAHIVPEVYTTPQGFVRLLLPWHPAVSELAEFAPLPSGVRGVTVQFHDNDMRLIQTAHLKLNHPVARPVSVSKAVKVGNSNISMAVALITGVDVMRLQFNITVKAAALPASTIVHVVPLGPFAKVRGQTLVPLDWDSTCYPRKHWPISCITWAIFPRFPPHSRLIISAPGFRVYGDSGRQSVTSAAYKVSLATAARRV